MKIEFKHTPGPWFYQTDADVYTHIIRPEKFPGRIIGSALQQDDEETKANAILMAAAPELLAQLTNMVNCWDADTFQDLDIEVARAIIKKATE
jgi:hypothetical protein